MKKRVKATAATPVSKLSRMGGAPMDWSHMLTLPEKVCDFTYKDGKKTRVFTVWRSYTGKTFITTPVSGGIKPTPKPAPLPPRVGQVVDPPCACPVPDPLADGILVSWDGSYLLKNDMPTSGGPWCIAWQNTGGSGGWIWVNLGGL